MPVRKVLFKEEQRFRQWWLWLILAPALSVSLGSLFNTLLPMLSDGNSWNNNRGEIFSLLGVTLLVTLILVGLLYLFFSDGSTLLLGTRRITAITYAMEKMMKKGEDGGSS